jgi:hypothetical protein
MSRKQVLNYAACDGKDVEELNNFDDLFDSDILILPIDCRAMWCVNWWFENTRFVDTKKEYSNIKIKFYVKNHNESTATFYLSDESAFYSDCIDLGEVIVSTVDGLIQIADFLKSKYGNSTEFNITLYNKKANHLFDMYSCKGTVDEFFKEGIAKLKSDMLHDSNI